MSDDDFGYNKIRTQITETRRDPESFIWNLKTVRVASYDKRISPFEYVELVELLVESYPNHLQLVGVRKKIMEKIQFPAEFVTKLLQVYGCDTEDTRVRLLDAFREVIDDSMRGWTASFVIDCEKSGIQRFLNHLDEQYTRRFPDEIMRIIPWKDLKLTLNYMGFQRENISLPTGIIANPLGGTTRINTPAGPFYTVELYPVRNTPEKVPGTLLHELTHVVLGLLDHHYDSEKEAELVFKVLIKNNLCTQLHVDPGRGRSLYGEPFDPLDAVEAERVAKMTIRLFSCTAPLLFEIHKSCFSVVALEEHFGPLEETD